MLLNTNMSPADALRRFQFWKDIRIRAGWHLQSHVRREEYRVTSPDGLVTAQAGIEDCRALFEASAPFWRSECAIVLMHSLAGSPALLTRLERRLNEAGHETANVAYPNLFLGMDEHVRQVASLIEAMAVDGIRQVSFVGHSYGGLLARALRQAHLPVERGPIVFFGTPNGGSSLGAMLCRFPGYRACFGLAGRDVLKASVDRLPLPDTPALVVAGGLGRHGFNPLLHGDNDGIVTVAETRLPATHDFAYLGGCHHRYLPRSPRGIAAALAHLDR